MAPSALLPFCGGLLLAVAQACPTVELVYQPEHWQINASTFPGNKGGLEDGTVVRRADGGFTMIAAEMYADPHWINMRLGIYKSADGMDWQKVRAIRTSTSFATGVYNTTAGPHAASWGPFLLLDPRNNTWLLSYVGYRSAGSNSSGWLENYDGTIYSRYAEKSGDAGLDGSFGEPPAPAPPPCKDKSSAVVCTAAVKQNRTYCSSAAGRKSCRLTCNACPSFPSAAFAGDSVLLAPDDFEVNGPWPWRCQGMQGTDSFYPYQLTDGTWAGVAGTSMQQHSWKPGAPGSGQDKGKWPVSLATAPAISGPWARFNPTNSSFPQDAPCLDINGGRTENPIVTRRPDDPHTFQMIYDDLGGESRGFGYACSEDGLSWSAGTAVTVPGGTRTPFALIAMTDAELLKHKADILMYGVMTPADFNATNTSLQWAFYTASQRIPGFEWEGFSASIVRMSW